MMVRPLCRKVMNSNALPTPTPRAEGQPEMSDYGVFEASSTDGHEEEQRQRQATRDLGRAIEAAREGFGVFLGSATDKQDYSDRLALVMNDLMQKVADSGVMPVPGVMRKVKAALRPEFKKAGKFQPGDKVMRSGYPGTVQNEYLPGMYEVRLESGEVVVSEDELTKVSSRKQSEFNPNITDQQLIDSIEIAKLFEDNQDKVDELETEARSRGILSSRKQAGTDDWQINENSASFSYDGLGDGVWGFIFIERISGSGMWEIVVTDDLDNRERITTDDDSIEDAIASAEELAKSEWGLDPFMYSSRKTALNWHPANDGAGWSSWDQSGTPPQGLSGQIVHQDDGRIMWYVEDPYDDQAGTVEYGFADSDEDAKSKVENLLSRLGVASKKEALELGEWEEDLPGLGYGKATKVPGGGYEVYIWDEAGQNESLTPVNTPEQARSLFYEVIKGYPGSGFDHIDF